MIDFNIWKDFSVEKLFEVNAGKYYYSDEYEEGLTPYISATAENNGISQRINLKPDFVGNVIVAGKVGCTAFYQLEDFCATSDVNIFRAKNFEMNPKIGLFITSVLNFSENYKWCYGRQCRVGDSKKIILKLPIELDCNSQSKMDNKKTFSGYGYIPDFKYMEEFITDLENINSNKQEAISNCLITQNPKSLVKIETCTWKEFYLHKLFKTSMGNGIDANKTTKFNPKYNYVSRDSNGNGVVDFVDEIEGEKPFSEGTLTLALGGSFLGSCFIQKEPFYTAQNVGILEEKELLSIYVKLFITAVIRNECKIKYQAFGRELNSHFRKDFTIKLPVACDGNKVIVDKTKKYSDLGYVPDWKWMEEYMKSLPYGDKI